jgi:hypothetical protein
VSELFNARLFGVSLKQAAVRFAIPLTILYRAAVFLYIRVGVGSGARYAWRSWLFEDVLNFVVASIVYCYFVGRLRKSRRT